MVLNCFQYCGHLSNTCLFVCSEESYGAIYFSRLRSGLLDLRNLLNQNVKVGLGTGISSHFIYRELTSVIMVY